jgi:NAD(P)-dependent dehydrogenase (short-subunit alcohol dehydrogenase family)
VHFIPIELSSFLSVHKAAAEVQQEVSKINVLINNEGIMALHEFKKSEGGIEMQFVTNHLGHFLVDEVC